MRGAGRTGRGARKVILEESKELLGAALLVDEVLHVGLRGDEAAPYGAQGAAYHKERARDTARIDLRR